MPMAPKVISVYELIQHSCPLTGAARLLHFPSSLPCCNASSSSPDVFSCTSSFSSSSSSSELLTPLDRPVVIIGTVELPVAFDSPGPCSRRHCFCFSDGSASVCCDILNFDTNIIGRRIKVLAWNFIPISCSDGFLEIISWSYDISHGLCRHFDTCTFPSVQTQSVSSEDSSKPRYNVHGLVISVSPVSLVSCSFNRGRSLTSKHRTPENVYGFLTELKSCKCKLWMLKGKLVPENMNHSSSVSHAFNGSTFLYFIGPSSLWRPLLLKLLGTVVFLSSPNKKMVFIGEDSVLMYVSSQKSSIYTHLSPSITQFYGERAIKWNGELGSYTGIVRGIHVKGKIVELDDDVWLVLGDKHIIIPHGLRVGAIVSAVNVHLFKGGFSWGRVLMLGACIKTEIMIETFSPSHTRFCIATQTQSLLANFIESLTFPARFWTFLLIACMRKKFVGILSDKEILGSKKSFQGNDRMRD